ncbi:MAG: hypothetical protein AAGM22_05970 [Acidobacteriota bacterium]
MMKKLLLGLAVFGLLGAGPAMASESDGVDAGPAAVGQQAAEIAAQSSDGQDYASSQVLSGDKRLVLVFFRGSW